MVLLDWLLKSDEPWTRYRTLLDLQEKQPEDPEVVQVRNQLSSHPFVQALIADAATWEGVPLKRHNDASHPMTKLTTLAEMGLRYSDPGIAEIVNSIVQHQSNEGAFETLCNIHPRYGGTGENQWAWMLCDAPVVLYILKAMQAPFLAAIGDSLMHLLSRVTEHGWGCGASPVYGNFRGPGRSGDPCPFANLVALKALTQFPEYHASVAAQQGVDVLLWHWEHQKERKLYLFGIGTDFRKLKYPFVWYDILHVVDVLSQFPFVHEDARFREMVTEITVQADREGRFTASSMYRAWKDWSFADKKKPSSWLTFLVLRILKRLQVSE